MHPVRRARAVDGGLGRRGERVSTEQVLVVGAGRRGCLGRHRGRPARPRGDAGRRAPARPLHHGRGYPLLFRIAPPADAGGSRADDGADRRVGGAPGGSRRSGCDGPARNMRLGQLPTRGEQPSSRAPLRGSGGCGAVVDARVRASDPRAGRPRPRPVVSRLGAARGAGRAGGDRAHDAIPGPGWPAHGDPGLGRRWGSRPRGSRSTVGLEVAGIVDVSSTVRGPAELWAAARRARGSVPSGRTPSRPPKARRKWARSDSSASIRRADSVAGTPRTVQCDTVCLALGLIPNVELLTSRAAA